METDLHLHLFKVHSNSFEYGIIHVYKFYMYLILTFLIKSYNRFLQMDCQLAITPSTPYEVDKSQCYQALFMMWNFKHSSNMALFFMAHAQNKNKFLLKDFSVEVCITSLEGSDPVVFTVIPILYMKVQECHPYCFPRLSSYRPCTQFVIGIVGWIIRTTEIPSIS